MERRDFLKNSSMALTGLVVAFNLPSTMKHALAADPTKAPKVYTPDAFIRIASDNTITITINKLEMGQGVNTSMAQLIAEELDVDWTKIQSVACPVGEVYNHTIFGAIIMTGGSTALASSWEQYRKIGAAMREVLMEAAAKKWGIAVKDVKAQNGFITSSKGKLSYGELAEAASRQEFPKTPKLKASKDFKVIGKSLRRVDAIGKTDGTAIFGMDVRIPGMLYACIARAHLEGGKLKSFNESAAKKVPGVVDVVKFKDYVAVIAQNTYAAKIGKEALQATFDIGDNATLNSADLMASFKKAGVSHGKVAEARGNVDTNMQKAKTHIEAEYEFPFLAHAAMEPLNCTINYDGKKAELWSGFQMPTNDRGVAAQILGLNPEDVTLHTVYAGGSFGRRGAKTSDFTAYTCELAKIVKKPLKVVWTREDDMHAGFYRPMNYHKVKIGLDEKKKLVGWDHHVVGQSIMEGGPFAMMVKNGLEDAVSEGISDTKYNFEHFRCEQTRPQTPVTTLWWRSVGHTHTGFVMETMMDELAHAQGIDPLKLRKELLKKNPKHLSVLELLEKQTGWGKKKAPAGRAWGLAIHESFGTVVGEVAEVSIENGLPRIHKVWAAVNCGQVVNPEQARTQVEGGIVFGLSAALHQEITIRNGQVQQSNYDNYQVMRIQDMPQVMVEFVKTTEPPSGLGEPGVPPAAPAVANALFQLTKKRIRVLPFSKGMKA
jgi:isoquinoline 1-oxidoreductase beta subunit